MDRRLEVGSIAPNFDYINLDGDETSFYKSMKDGMSYLIFLRYYGCTVCQYIIRELSSSYDKFLERDVDIFVVLQSRPDIIKEAILKDQIPVNIISDVEQHIYKLYDVGSAKNKVGLASIKTVETMKKAKKLNLVHGEYEGNELQLPATFLIDKDKTLRYIKYGFSAADVPELEELLNIINNIDKA